MILERDLDGIERGALDDLVGEDVALLAQNLGEVQLHGGSGDLDDLLTGKVSVTDSGQKICNRISHFFVFLWTGASGDARYPIVVI